MLNIDAMICAITAGDSTTFDVYPDMDGDAYERLFAIRNALAANNAEVISGRQPKLASDNDGLMKELIEHLAENFGEMPDPEDLEVASDLVKGVLTNPSELEHLSERQIEALADTITTVGVIRTMLYSYAVQLSDEFQSSRFWFDWIVCYRRYMVV